LFDRIHLPDVMRMPCGLAFGRWLASGGQGRRLTTTEIALQRSFAGNHEVRMEQLEAHADETGTPGGMGFVQEDTLLQQVLEGRLPARARPIAWLAGFGTALVEALHEILNRADRELQLSGDGDAIEPLLGQGEDPLAHWRRDGPRHHRLLKQEKGDNHDPSYHPLDGAKPRVGIRRKTSCRVTDIPSLALQACVNH
jgi:hypothetical protein